MTAPSLPRIFVQIVAYRDPECHATITDLFEQATHPERIHVGVCWQYDAAEDAAYLNAPYPRQEQVRIKHYTLEEAQGAGWARQEAMKLWQGEEYTLQIQAHMRFMPGWDETLLDMLLRCDSPHPVLALWPPYYKPEGPREIPENCLRRTRVNFFGAEDDPQILHLTTDYYRPPHDARPGLYPTPFWVGCFMFARTEVFFAVPHDPHIYFWGEELAYSARLWTHGYDLFQHDTHVIYHQWFREDTRALQTYRAHDDARNRRSLARVKHLLGIDISEDTQVLKQLERYGHGTRRELADFWAFAGVDMESRSITAQANTGEWNLAARTAAIARMPEHERIFVQIAAYRDPECQWTVKDLFETASHPERITVGICWQFIAEEDADCFKQPSPYPDQMRVIEVDARKSKGACWARAAVQTLWQDEEYTLQIDSHMRFEPGWDETLIAMLQGLPGKAVLTTYPAGYTPPDKIPHRVTHRLVAKQFDQHGIFTMLSRPVAKDAAKPVLGAFMGACMLFGRSDIIRDVPYDPHLYFFGEEITLSARLWTHGYDIYHPYKPVMYHDWNRTTRRTHFDDHTDWEQLNRLSFARTRHMLGVREAKNKAALVNLEQYGLGTSRSMAEYEAFCGINFNTQTISHAAYQGHFPASSSPAPAMMAPLPVSLPKPTLMNDECAIFDDFLSEEEYQRLYDWAIETDYQYINTQGKIKRVWDISNGFPLRSTSTLFHYPDPLALPANKPEMLYPSNTPLDRFSEKLYAASAEMRKMVGEAGREGWEHFSVTSWLYPPGTGLSLHDDGSGVYTGAYVYFLNPEWKPHWGGLLLVMDGKSNLAIQSRKAQGQGMAMHKRKFLHASEHEALVMQSGLAQCVMPKQNRLVFIHPDTFHLVTRVLPEAGDNVRMTLAGFFKRWKERKN